MKQLMCLFKKHNWLLQGEQATKLFKANEEVAESYLYYECQRCQRLTRIEVMHLNNLPNSNITQERK